MQGIPSQLPYLAALAHVSDTPEFFLGRAYNVRDIEDLTVLGTGPDDPSVFAYRLLLGDVGDLDRLRVSARPLDRPLSQSNVVSATLGLVPVTVDGKFPAGLPCLDVVLNATGGVVFDIVGGFEPGDLTANQ